MNGSAGSVSLAVVEPLLCLLGLWAIIRDGHRKDYKFLCMFLGFRATFTIVLLPLFVYGGYLFEAHTAYRLYFDIYWMSFAIESVLALLIIYGIFDLALAPLDAIRSLGMLVFRWATTVSLAITMGLTVVPPASQRVIIAFITELQRTQSILTLGLLLFVCFAIKPLGLAYSSRAFGVSLGLGVLATSNLVTSAYMTHFRQMYSTINVAGGISTCVALSIWLAYFALPEPKRRIVVLPTTSPFLRWNQIAEVLGDPPGFVAIAGVPPELFAPAELEVMRRASLKMKPSSALGTEHTQTAWG